MDYQSMKRKELQALCKKHGVPANLSNREMADRLSSILKVNEKLTSSRKVIDYNSKVKTKVVKKVRFSSQNQTFSYEISGYKRGGRRRYTLKPVPKRQIQPTENDVFSPPVGRKRAKIDVKKQMLEVRSADECNVIELGDGNVIGGLIKRQLRNREVVLGKSDGDLAISRNKATQRGSKMVRNNVPEENVIASKDAKLQKTSKTIGRITRSRAQFECRDSENEEIEGDFEKSQFEEPSKGVGRNALMRRTAKADRDLRKRKQDVTNDEYCKMTNAANCNVVELGKGNVIGGLIKRQLRNREVVVGKSDGDLVISRKKVTPRDSEMARNEVPEEDIIASKDAKLEKISKTVGRITRSQARFESRDFENEKDEGECEMAPQPEELLKGVGRNALMQKRKQDVMNDECCKILNGNSRKVESVNRSTRYQAKPVVEVGADEGENEEEIVRPEELSKGLGKYNLRKKSVVPDNGKVGNDKVKMKKETRKRSRNANLEGISELEAILYTSKEFAMFKDVSAPSGLSRSTRCNSVIFISTDSTNERLDSRQNILQKENYVTKSIPWSSRQSVAGKDTAVSPLVATETATERTAKIQLNKGSGRVAEASKCKLTSKSEEVNKVANQSFVQSTVLERSNANFVGREELSGKGAQNSDEIIFNFEASVSNAGNAICNEAKTEYNLTIYNTEPEEVLYNDRASQVVGETIINEGYERNLLVGGSAFPISEKTDGKDAKIKETEVSEGYTQDAMRRENEFFEQNPNNISKERRGRCMHELSDAEGAEMIITEEMGTDSAHGTVNKGSFPYELDYLKNHSDHEKVSSVVFLPIESRKSLSNSKDKLGVQGDIQETFEAEVNVKVGGLKVELQEQSLLQLALDDLRDGIKGPDANSNPGKGLCQLSGNCNSVNRTEEQVCDDICSKEFPLDVSNAVRSSELVLEKIYENVDLDEEKNSSVDIIYKDVPSNEDNAANKGIDDKGSNGESDVEQSTEVAQKENPTCTLKVELQDKNDTGLVTPQENGAAGTSMTELISTESDVLNEKEVETMLRSVECIERVDNLTVKECKSVNRNSHAEGNDVGTLAQATRNHLVEEEATEAHDGSVQNVKIAADKETHTVSMEERESLKEVENVETSLPFCPEIPRKTSRDEFAESNHSAPGFSNKVLHANGKYLEERSNGIVGLVPLTDEEQVCADIYSKDFSLDESNVVSSSELISEKIYRHADLVGETNSSVDIFAKDMPFNEDYAPGKEIDGKGLNEESDVEKCADVTKEENRSCALKVDLRDKSDNEVVAPQENDAAGLSLIELISKESEVSYEKEVKTMHEFAECIERLDSLTVKVWKSENRNSHTVGNDVGAFAQVTSNHLAEEKAMEEDDGSVLNLRIAADEEAHKVAMEKREFLEEAENVETSAPVSPEILMQTSRDEFAEITDNAPGVLNEVLQANGEDLEKRCNEFVGFVPPADEARFGDLDNNSIQNVLKLERSASVISDDVMSMSGRAAYGKENARIIASDLNSNDYSSDDEKEGNQDAISQGTKTDSDDHSILSNYPSSNLGIAADATVVAVDGKGGSENIEADNKWLEKTPTFSQTALSERKRGEKKSSEGRFFVDTSSDKTAMGSANDAVDTDVDSTFKIDSQITEKTTLTDQKDSDGPNDSVHGLHIEDNARTANKQHIDQKDKVIDIGFTDGNVCSTSNKFLCSERRKSISEVAEEGACLDEVCNMAVNENIEELPAVSSSTPRMSTDFSAFSPSIENSKYESKSLEFHSDFPQLTSWEMNKILGTEDHVNVDKSSGGILEGSLTTQDYEDPMRVKENLRINELGDQQTTEKHLDEQEHHTHQTVSDQPICDNEEQNRQNELFAVSLGDLYHEIQKDKSNASPEKVTLKENNTTKGSNIADLDEFKAEYFSHDLNETDHISVDPDVFSCSRSRVKMYKELHAEATEKMNTPVVEHVGTILPITPQEPCADSENTREASHEISGTILQQLFPSGSGWKEKICNEMAEHCNDVGREEMADKEIDREFKLGNNCRNMPLLFQDSEAMIENNEAADSFGLEHNVDDSQEVVTDQLIDCEAAANETTFEDDIHCSSINQPCGGNKANRYVILTEEPERFCCFDAKIVATSDCKKIVNFQNSIVAPALIAEMAVDCSTVSPVITTSNCENKTVELNVESHIFPSPEMNLFLGSSGQDEIENLDAKDVKENVMIMEQVVAKSTEGQLHEQKAEEVSEISSTRHSDLDEPICKGSKGSTEQENMLAAIKRTPERKQLKNESLKFENTNLTVETADDNAWKLELKLLSHPQRSPESKTRPNHSSLFGKKLNSSARKQNNKSTLIRRTPKQLEHDMKENFPSTKNQKTGNFAAQKSLLKRRVLEDLRN